MSKKSNSYFNIKPNGTFIHDNVCYHKHQYVSNNPLYKESLGSGNSYDIIPKEDRKHITKLKDKSGNYNILPKRINSIIESQKQANYDFKSHKKIALNKELYVKVMKFFFKRLVYYLIKTGREVKLPYVKLGSLQICQVKSKKNNAKYVNFNKSKIKGETVFETPSEKLKGYKPYLNHASFNTSLQERFDVSNSKIRIDQTNNYNYYNWNFIRTVFRPNTYSKHNNEITLVKYFVEEGYKRYKKL